MTGCPQAWHGGLPAGLLIECRYEPGHRGPHRSADGDLEWSGKLTPEEELLTAALREKVREAETRGPETPEQMAARTGLPIELLTARVVFRPEPNDGPGPDGHHTVTGECFACMVGVASGPESHGDRCALSGRART